MAGFLLYLACEPARRFFIANTLPGFFSNLQSSPIGIYAIKILIFHNADEISNYKKLTLKIDKKDDMLV